MPPPKLAELVKQRAQSSSTPARKAFVDAAAATAAKEQGNKLLAQNDLLAAYAQYSAGLASADASDAAKLFGNRSAAAQTRLADVAIEVSHKKKDVPRRTNKIPSSRKGSNNNA